MSILHILTYMSIIIFIAISIKRAMRIANQPVHLRWELYPVPHEKGRAHYGGSKLEEVDWWTKEHKKDHLNEAKEMGSEILFLKAVYEFNRSLWIGSFPFHLGLYLLIGTMGILFISGIMQLAGIDVNSGSGGFAGIMYIMALATAWAGSIAGLFGSIRLMFSRIADTALRDNSTVSHFFNIVLIGGIFATLLLLLITESNAITTLVGFYAGLVSFSAMPELSLIAYVHIFSTLLFICYLPFTHMSHMYMKYFLYHFVRWEDEPNIPGSALNKRLAQQLTYPVSWSAKHVGADGKKSWGDIVSDIPEDM